MARQDGPYVNVQWAAMSGTAINFMLPRLRAATACAALSLLPAVAAAFGFDDVAARARQLAASSYKAPPKNIPKKLASLSYDQ